MLTFIAGVVGYLLGKSHVHPAAPVVYGPPALETLRPYIESCPVGETRDITYYGRPVCSFGFVKTEPYKR